MPNSFGSFEDYERARRELDEIFIKSLSISDKWQFQKVYILAAIRRTNSLAIAMLQSVESRNAQMTTTLLRLHLDTLARFYVLFWADEDPFLSAEGVAQSVFEGTLLNSINFTEKSGKKRKANDRYLIDKISSLDDWIVDVYKNASGAIHFSHYHIFQMFDQAEKRHTDINDGALVLESISMSPHDSSMDSERFIKVRQAFLHITLMLMEAIRHRCEILLRPDNSTHSTNAK